MRTHTTDGKKLGNDHFLSKAPVEVIEEQRRRRADAEQTQAKLTDALERLASGVGALLPLFWRIMSDLHATAGIGAELKRLPFSAIFLI